ncbi:MAG: DNA-binding response regulator [Acholeplasmatales bacterium]|nr:MAG: DNA-binding response regulator [Acholeplasmatales bacterium]
MPKHAVLIVEDEPTINRMVTSYFKAAEFRTFSVHTGQDALDTFEASKIDVVCLDIMLPDLSGWVVASTIRRLSDVPIIMMSALSEEEDILKGYTLNVDDYITKPFNPKILVAKARRLLSRIGAPANHHERTVYDAGPIRINTAAHKVYVDEVEITLSKTEYDLLAYFVKHPDRICSRNHLLDEIWGIDVFVEDRIVDTYVKRLRKHLGQHASMIKTVFGVGYRFEYHDA